MSIEKVNDFLGSVLSSVFVEIDEDAQLIIAMPTVKPTAAVVRMEVNNKLRDMPMYLPTEEMLKAENNDKIKFFPFAESIFQGNSEILNWLIRMLSARIHTSTYGLLKALVCTAMDDSDKTYGNSVIEVLKGVKVKKTIGNDLVKLLRTMSKSKPFGPDAVAAIGLSRKAKGQNTRQGYMRIVNTEADKVFGAKPNQQVRDLLHDLLEVVYGDLNDYVCGSSSKMCPSFFAVLKAFSVVADRINLIANDLGKYKDADIIINDSWFDMLADESKLEVFHSKYIKAKFPGNVGTKAKDSKVSSESKEQPVQHKNRFSKSAPASVEHEVVEIDDTVVQQEPEQSSGFRLGGGGVKKNSFQPSNPASSFQPQNQQQNLDGMNSGFNQTHSNQFEVERPQVARNDQPVHACDINGQPIYWESGEPYKVKTRTGNNKLPMIWAQSGGMFLYHPDGEPMLIDAPNQNSGGGFNNGGFGGGPRPNKDPSQMTFAERCHWENEMQRHQNQQNNGFNSGFNNGGGFNQNSGGFSNGGGFGFNNNNQNNIQRQGSFGGFGGGFNNSTSSSSSGISCFGNDGSLKF